VHAVDRYLRDTGEIESVARRPWRAVREILDAYCGAGVAGVRADDRSLLVREGPATACRVDLQALWFNALSVGSFLAQTLDGGRAARELNRRARACRRSFLAAFWDAREERLADAVGAASRDTTLRARQLLAVGLPNSMLGRPEQQCVVRRIEAEILDPCGLRSAAAIEPGWLGAFAAAYRQAFGRGPATAARLAEIIGGLEHEIARQGLGSLPERFTLDAREPAGMIASALSVAGVACAYREAISSGRP
jgi:glycogen debranching enzyme